MRGQHAQSQSRRQKAHRTVNNDCPVHHRTVRWPHLSELQRSNPNGWVTWLAHQTVRCARTASPTGTLVVGAINTPNHHISRHSSFQPIHSIQELVHSIQDTNRLNQNLSKSQFHSKQLVTRRESFVVFFWALALESLFFFPISCSQHLCNQSKKHQLCGDRLREGKGWKRPGLCDHLNGE
jgi:hypothetical protein